MMAERQAASPADRRTQGNPPAGPEAGPEAEADPSAASNCEVIHELVHDLVAKQQALSTLIDRLLVEEAQSPGTLLVQDLARLMALHSQNASRLGRLLRDKRALSGEAADGIDDATSQALDELSSDWGIEL
jgi:hypothetical protein